MKTHTWLFQVGMELDSERRLGPRQALVQLFLDLYRGDWAITEAVAGEVGSHEATSWSYAQVQEIMEDAYSLFKRERGEP
jgi:hypothetical protein